MQDFKPLSELISLNGKNAIVTGGGRGIGLAISRRLAEAGASVMIADINISEGQNSSESLNALGYSTHFIKCDVTVEDNVKETIADTVKILGSVDILVNNAGIYPRNPLDKITGKDFEKVISVNLVGTFLCSRYAVQEMIRRQSGGCIINIASIEAIHPSSSGMSAYDASKGGVLMLTRSMAHELGAHAIRVNAIAPGGIKTQGILARAGVQQEKDQLKELKSFISRIALDRMGDADDIARIALFLASDLSSYITGGLIVADGGYLVS